MKTLRRGADPVSEGGGRREGEGEGGRKREREGEREGGRKREREGEREGGREGGRALDTPHTVDDRHSSPPGLGSRYQCSW